MLDVQAVVDAVLSVTQGPASHHRPVVTGEDVLAIAGQSRRLDSYHYINLLQDRLKDKLGVGHATAVASGSVALEVALTAVGVKRGDWVLVPTLSFVAVANAVTHLGAEPVFVDSSRGDLGIDVRIVERYLTYRGASPAAIVAVHMLGHPCQIDAICKLGRQYAIPVVEDAAEAIGSSVGGRPCGSWGTVGVISFNLNKTVTGGGGGAVLTHNDELGQNIARLVTTARVDHPWLVEHDMVAWNHRMPMLSAALAGSQMNRLDSLVRAKRALAAAYRIALDGVGGVTFHVEPPGTTSNYWLPTILVPPESRDAVLTALHDRLVMARAIFTPMHRLPMYRDDRGEWPVADEVWSRGICLPGSVELASKFV